MVNPHWCHSVVNLSGRRTTGARVAGQNLSFNHPAAAGISRQELEHSPAALVPLCPFLSLYHFHTHTHTHIPNNLAQSEINITYRHTHNTDTQTHGKTSALPSFSHTYTTKSTTQKCLDYLFSSIFYSTTCTYKSNLSSFLHIHAHKHIIVKQKDNVWTTNSCLQEMGPSDPYHNDNVDDRWLYCLKRH